MFEKKKIIENGINYKVDTVLSYDEEKVKEFANSVNEQVKVDAVDAKISVNGSNISITPEVIGKQLDIEDLCNKIKECIDPDPEKVETVIVDLQDYSPKTKMYKKYISIIEVKGNIIVKDKKEN